MAAKPNISGATLAVPQESQNITRDKIKRMLPKGTSVSITDEILRSIQTMGEEADLPQNLLEEDFMTYLQLISRTKGLGIQHLINAIKYCNLKRTRSNVKAWAITFPKKYDRLVDGGKSIDNHVSMYEKSFLVQEIDKEMLIPVHLQYAAAFHKLAQQNIRIAMGDAGVDEHGERKKVSPMVMQQACKTGMEMFRAPETAKIDITVSEGEKSLEIQQQQADQLTQFVRLQQQQFKAGKKPIDIQKVHLIDSSDTIDADIVEDGGLDV